MKPEDIKVGETYNVRVKVADKTGNRIITHTVIEDGLLTDMAATIFFEEEVAAFSSINPYEPLKLATINRIPETYPKYDPNRPFREKDIVRYKPLNGRECPAMPCDEFYREKTLTVVANEDCNHRVLVQTQDGREKYIMFCYLELVTPVEELERYIVIHNKNEKYFDVCWKDDDEPDGRTGRTRRRTTFWYHQPPKTYTQKEANAAAEAECARLNAEYRKEQA